jgi:hypothetical protein
VAASRDQPQAPDRLAEAGDQAAAWSRDDLQQRLEHLSPTHPSSLADKPEQSFWSEVPRFQDAWAEHLRRWPEDRRVTTVDRSRDPEGSWRGDGNQYLSPEQHARVTEVIAEVQEAEKGLTPDMQATARENTRGAWLDGMKHRLKGEDRLKEKFAELSASSAPDASPAELMREIPDAIRYTFCAHSEDYQHAYMEISDLLHAQGHEMRYSHNHWNDSQYKGINTRWVTPTGQQFEVQFHTAESLQAKQEITHTSYERLRNALTKEEERGELKAFQQDVSSSVPVPEGAAKIPNYRQEGR